ncbi:hypothetical protein U9M48_035919 [Paspalum notatum var. saurae]|uniref:Reverse transcriptase/retrotransposon-derived protein RNase H-like domain-containing protein n=1 Tax=Paspalum notatum var. saurae TaxID=547442 RepID=A0AAQ3UCI6_PASNO
MTMSRRAACAGRRAPRLGPRHIDFYALPLNSYDMILGVHWLRMLGPIQWDFSQHTMCFVRRGKQIKWTGLDTSAALSAACSLSMHSDPHMAVLREEFAGVIRPSSSAFSSSALMIKKKDGSWRFCVNYRALDSKTVKDKFSIPVVENSLMNSGARLSSPSSTCVQGITNCLKKSKCEFGLMAVAYLGHAISKHGVAMDGQKVQAVLDWPRPTLVRALRGFLGLVGYYRLFINNYGTMAALLTALLKRDNFHWSDAATSAFTALQQAITTVPVLRLPDFNLDFMVECDESGSASLLP